MDNKMDKVADILGVRLNEIFHIVGHGNKQYLLSKFGCLCKVEEGGIELPVDDGLDKLIIGMYEIVEKPSTPARGSFFYTPDFGCKELFRPSIWANESQQLEAYKNGVVCKTPDEAIEMAKKMLGAVGNEK